MDAKILDKVVFPDIIQNMLAERLEERFCKAVGWIGNRMVLSYRPEITPEGVNLILVLKHFDGTIVAEFVDHIVLVHEVKWLSAIKDILLAVSNKYSTDKEKKFTYTVHTVHTRI